MCGFQSEYRKCKRPFPPTARAHLVADPAPPEATFQPFSRPRGSRGRLAGRPLSAPRSERAPWGSLAPRSSPHLPSYRVPGRHRGSPITPPNRLQPPHLRATPAAQATVTSHRFCPCPASEPAACRLPTGLRQPLARWRSRGWSPERGEPTVFQGGACSREAARGRRTDTSAGIA